MVSVKSENEVSYAEIAHRLGISRERVRQIVMHQKLNNELVQTADAKINDVASPMSVMLTSREVSQLLNIHINTVRRWSDQGVLTAYRVGSRGDRRFMRHDIINFLTRQSKAKRIET